MSKCVIIKTEMKKMMSGFKFKGEYTITKYKALPWWMPRSWSFWMHKNGLTTKLSESHHTNLIVFNTGRGLHMILQNLGGDTSHPLPITSAAIGTGQTLPDIADTDLEEPVLTDIPISTLLVNEFDIDIEWFITDDELSPDTYYEFGVYCSTRLFARSNIDPSYMKASGEDTLVAYKIAAAST